MQIPMENTTEDSSLSNEKEVEHVDESSGHVCNNGTLVMEDNQSMQHCRSAHGNLVGHHHQEVMEPISKETNEELVAVDGRDPENLSKIGKATLDSDSASCDHILCNLSPSNIQSHSEASKAGVTADMDKASNHVRRPSSRSISGSRNCGSKNDSRSDTSKTEYKDDKSSSPEQHLVQGEQNCYGGVRFPSLVGLEIPMDHAKASTWAGRQGLCNEDHLRRGTRKGRQHSYNFDDNDSIEDEFRYRETEMSNGYRGRRFVEKLERRNSSTEHSHRKIEPHFREGKEICIRRDRNGREYLDERFMAADDEMKQRERYFRERGHCDEVMSGVSHKESDLLISENTSFQSDKKRFLQLRRKNENDRRFREEAEDDDCVFECRYREEFFQEKHGRHVLYYGTEDFIQEKYRRRIPHPSREKVRPNRRERDPQTSCFGLDDSWRDIEDDGNYRRNPNHNPLSRKTGREVHIANGRGWRDSSPPRNHAYDSWRCGVEYEDNWRSNERYADHWRSNERYADHWRIPDLHDKQSNKYREGYFFVKGKEFSCQSRHRRDIDEDSYHAGEITGHPNNDVSDDERKRYRCQWTDEEARLGRREQDGSHDPEAPFLSEWRSGHEHCHLDHDSAHDRKHLEDFWLERSGKKITVGKSVYSKASKCISYASDIADWGMQEVTSLRCKEPVNLHLNGWERKVKLGKPKPIIHLVSLYMCKYGVGVSHQHGLHWYLVFIKAFAMHANNSMCHICIIFFYSLL